MKSSDRMYFYCFILLIICCNHLNAQVTIGSSDAPHTSAVLELKIEGDSMGFKGPDVELSDIYDTLTVKSPATGLLVFNTTDSPEDVTSISERVRRNKYYYWSGTQWSEFISWDKIEENIEQAFSGMGIPRPAIFTLDGSDYIYRPILSDMKGINNPFATSSIMTLPMKEEVNHTDSTVIMQKVGNSTKITFEPGIYDISFSYELIPTVNTTPECKDLFYYMEFPLNTIGTNGDILHSFVRIDSGAAILGGRNADHGNTINYVTVLYEKTEWEVKFAVNGTGTCAKRTNYSIPNRSTYLYISRIGDPNPDNHK